MDGFCFSNKSTMGFITGIVSQDRKLNVVFASGSLTFLTPERTAAEATDGLAATSAAPAAPAAPNARNRRLVRAGSGAPVVALFGWVSDISVPFHFSV
jgi:hypothetical protein